MAANMVGADLAEMEALARALDGAAVQLKGVAAKVRSGIEVSAWVGPVAQRFRVEWNSGHSRQLQQAADALHQAARDVRAHADQQRAASAASGSSAGAAPGGAGAGAQQSLADARAKLLEQFKLWGIEVPSWLLETGETLDELKYPALAALPSALAGFLNQKWTLGKWFSAVKGVGLPFALVGLGMDAQDLREALAAGDEAAAWTAVADIAADIMTAGVPFGGVAWMVGTETGGLIFKGGDAAFHLTDHTYEYAAQQLFGQGVDVNNLTQAQTDALVQRYEGGAGIAYSITDGLRLTGIANGVADLVTTGDPTNLATGVTDVLGVTDAINAVSGAAYDRAEEAAHLLSDAAEALEGHKWPWER